MSVTARGGICVYDGEAIRSAISIADALDPVARALSAFSTGKSLSPPLTFIRLENGGEVHIKSGYAVGARSFVTKIASMTPSNRTKGLPTSNGLMLVCSAETGYPVALLHDNKYLTDIRTAAVGALAARLLAPEGVEAVGVLGSGGQAVLQVEALALVREFERVHLWARDRARADTAARELRRRLPNVRIEVRSTAEAVVRESTLVIAATASTEPIVKGEWLRPGFHITAIGADDAFKAEIDAACLERATFLACDSRDLVTQFGEVVAARRAGVDIEVDAELGDLLTGRVQFNRGDADITISKHVGIGIEDLFVAQAFLDRMELAASS